MSMGTQGGIVLLGVRCKKGLCAGPPASSISGPGSAVLESPPFLFYFLHTHYSYSVPYWTMTSHPEAQMDSRECKLICRPTQGYIQNRCPQSGWHSLLPA